MLNLNYLSRHLSQKKKTPAYYFSFMSSSLSETAAGIPAELTKWVECLSQKLHCGVMQCKIHFHMQKQFTLGWQSILLTLKYSCRNSYSYCIAVSALHKVQLFSIALAYSLLSQEKLTSAAKNDWLTAGSWMYSRLSKGIITNQSAHKLG